MHSEVWGDETARNYDDRHSEMFEAAAVTPTVDLLAELASGGKALEFAIGTGRIALPLADRGVEVSGIELSTPMIDALRAKPGSDRVSVTIGDMSSTTVDASFKLVYLVYNTITNLLTQEAQIACFENAAAHLEPGGFFLIETYVPNLQRLPFGERAVPFDLSDNHIGIDEYDVAEQMLTSHHVHIRPDRVVKTSGRFRYGWPAEYDLMARIAGLRLRDRWADWDRSHFDRWSTGHVSVWEKPA